MEVFTLGDKRIPKRCVISIGMFDGIHLGHRSIINKVLEEAQKRSAESMIVTFDRHPRRVLNHKKPADSITSFNHKVRLLDNIGIDNVVVIHFDEEFGKMSACSFVEHILVDQLDISGIVIGKDARFGSGGYGNAEFLYSFPNRKFDVWVVNPLKYKGLPISSTRIREAIVSCNLEAAREMLGRDVSVVGKVVHGDKRGRDIGFPTANIAIDHEVHPPAGVYGCICEVNGIQKRGVTNIGFRPTFYSTSDSSKEIIEVHIFDFEEDIYGEEIEVKFKQKIREERVFSNIKELKKQIEEDIEYWKSFKL